jgi:hypothetical protein
MSGWRSRLSLLLPATLCLSVLLASTAGADPGGSTELWRSDFGAGSASALRSLDGGSGVWNGRSNVSFGRHAGRDAWNVHLPADQSNGAKVHARFRDLGFEPRRSVRLDYEVFVPNAETLSLDLKLPGFASAPADRDLWYASSGGTKRPDSASVRIHTRKAGGWGIPHPYLEAYVYADRGGGQVRQDWGMYWRLSRSLNGTGSRKGDEFTVPIARWFTVSIEAEMNGPGKADGRLRVWLDGQKGIDIDDLVYVTEAPYAWSQTMFVSFYNQGSHPATTMRFANMRFGTVGVLSAPVTTAPVIAPPVAAPPVTAAPVPMPSITMPPTTPPTMPPTTAPPAPVGNHPVASVHDASIARLVALGIMSGTPDGGANASAPLTRGQMASLLQRALHLPPGDPNRFSDAGSTHAAAIGAIAEAGIATGFGDGTFRPDEHVTRGQMATVLTRAFALPTRAAPPFRDTATNVHQGSIAAVASSGIARGFGDGTFRPETDVTRGQMATFLVKAMSKR